MQGMLQVHISQFYNCSKVTSAGELYYICELGKYLNTRFGYVLSLDGVILEDFLKKSHLWDMLRIAIYNGYVKDTNLADADTEISIQSPLRVTKTNFVNILLTEREVKYNREDDLKRKGDSFYDFTTPLFMQFSLKTKTDKAWLWKMSGYLDKFLSTNNSTFNYKGKGRQIWLSMLAYVAVNRLMEHRPESFVIHIDSQATYDLFTFSYVITLLNKTDAIKDWVFLYFDEKLSKETYLQLYYCAWYQEGRDLGLTQNFHSIQDKLSYMNKLDITIGDTVLVYVRNKEQSNNYAKSIKSCRIAIIREIKDTKIRVEYINTVKTRQQGVEDWKDMTMKVKQMYGNKNPNDKLSTSIENLNIYDTGIGHLLYDELQFITPLDEAEEFVEQWVSNDKFKDKIRLSQNDLIYWVFKEYKVNFNEDRFLAKYFKGETPLYTRYMNGDRLYEFKVD
jgi:hypothetical protein